MHISEDIIYSGEPREKSPNIGVSLIDPTKKLEPPLPRYPLQIKEDKSIYAEIPSGSRFALCMGIVPDSNVNERDIRFSFKGRYGVTEIKFHTEILRYKTTQVVLGCQPGNHSTFVHYVPTDREREEVPSEYPNFLDITVSIWERDSASEPQEHASALLQQDSTDFRGDLAQTPALMVSQCLSSWKLIDNVPITVIIRDTLSPGEAHLMQNLEYLTKHRKEMLSMTEKLQANQSDLTHQLHRIKKALSTIEEYSEQYAKQREILRDELRNLVLQGLVTDDFSFPNQYLTHLCRSTLNEAESTESVS